MFGGGVQLQAKELVAHSVPVQRAMSATRAVSEQSSHAVLLDG